MGATLGIGSSDDGPPRRHRRGEVRWGVGVDVERLTVELEALSRRIRELRAEPAVDRLRSGRQAALQRTIGEHQRKIERAEKLLAVMERMPASDPYADGQVLRCRRSHGNGNIYTYALIRMGGCWFGTGKHGPYRIGWAQLVDWFVDGWVESVDELGIVGRLDFVAPSAVPESVPAMTEAEEKDYALWRRMHEMEKGAPVLASDGDGATPETAVPEIRNCGQISDGHKPHVWVLGAASGDVAYRCWGEPNDPTSHYDEVRQHLQGVHHNEAALTLSDREAHKQHWDEHSGFGTIRDHQFTDLSGLAGDGDGQEPTMTVFDNEPPF